MKRGRVEVEIGADGVAVFTIVNPPLNLLSTDVLLVFKESIEQALRRDDVRAIVITGSNGKFSGGFDVTAFGRKVEQGNVGFWSIDFITNTLEAAKKPLVAAIDGPALGGGLEIALACHARISTSNAQLGLPELRYGILPGFGGTQRLPRLVGLPKALEMMLMSKLVNGEEARSVGLVDAIATADELLSAARCWALDMWECRKPWISCLYRNDKLASLAEAIAILKTARAQTQKLAPNLKHPLVCLDVIEEGIVSGPIVGLWKEAMALQELRQSDTCKSLVHFFFSQYRASKIPGITDLGLIPRKITSVAVIGGGSMGSGIATVLILNNYSVILKEVNHKFLVVSIDRIRANLQTRVEKGKMTREELQKALSLLTGTTDYESFGGVDLVIEAVSENTSLKQQIFADLEKYCPENCIFASNTSTINLNLICKGTKSHHRTVGAHFFSPADVKPLMEIVPTERASPQVIVDLLSFGKLIKKVPVVVGNCTGSAVNRMFFPYTQAAMLLVEHGADVYQIDQAITDFGMPMGPFRWIDLVGFGVSAAMDTHFLENFPERSYKSMLISVMQEDNRAGESNSKGFYTYDSKGKASPDPEIKQYIDKARTISSASPIAEFKKLSDGDIVEMLFFPVVNEACRLLEEGIADKASDLDVAAVLGTGFPSYRGGIIFWANFIGSKYICSKLEKWSNIYGEFFKPCAYLAENASNGGSLESPMHAKSQL